MTFGKAIKEQRVKRGLTQAQLAEMLGKAESTVRTWELDRSSPDRKALYAMCEIFGITPDYFFYNTTPPDSMDGGLKHSFEVKKQSNRYNWKMDGLSSAKAPSPFRTLSRLIRRRIA